MYFTVITSSSTLYVGMNINDFYFVVRSDLSTFVAIVLHIGTVAFPEL